MDHQLSRDREASRRWVRAIVVIFVLMGFSFGTWLSRLPAVRDELGASTLQMSFYGLCLAAGSLAGMAIASRVIEQYGSRRVMTLAIVLQAILLPSAVSLILVGALPLGLAVLFAYGLCFSTTDIAMNVSGASAERVFGRPRLSLMHAGYSIGVMTAMGVGAVAETLRAALQLHFSLAMFIIAVSSLLVIRWVPANEQFQSNTAAGRSAEVMSSWKDRRVLLIGVITLSAGLLEGAPSDWLPLALVDGRGISNEFGAIMLGVFFGAVVTARLLGSALLARFSRVTVLRASFAIATVGVLLVVLVPTTFGMFAGTIYWGLGTGVCWPIAISAAADNPQTAARDVAAVSAVGYTSMLIGPMAFGVLGEQIGLLQSFWVLPLFALLGLVLAGVTQPRRR